MAPRVDALYAYLIGVSIVFIALIAATLLYFVIRFRARKGNERAPQIEGSLALEALWSIVPFVIAMTMFVWGAKVYFAMARPPDNAMDVFVVAKQWMWKIQHVEGNREIDELHVPVNQPVKLTMTSEDVIHSFYVPAFRVKADVLPDRYTTLWFQATKPGTYHLFCAEYCGTEHSRMVGKVIVMEPTDYQDWLKYSAGAGEKKTASAADLGRVVFEKQGCGTCHRADNGPLQAAVASSLIGPPLKGLYGSTVELADGSKTEADETYIRESITDPMSRIVRGYPPKMPTYRGRVSQEKLLQLITYIKTLATNGTNGSSTDSGQAEPKDDAARS